MLLALSNKRNLAPSKGLPYSSDGKESACKAGNPGSTPGSGSSWRRKWQSTPVFLPGKSHGKRSLGSYSPWGSKESEMIK